MMICETNEELSQTRCLPCEMEKNVPNPCPPIGSTRFFHTTAKLRQSLKLGSFLVLFCAVGIKFEITQRFLSINNTTLRKHIVLNSTPFPVLLYEWDGLRMEALRAAQIQENMSELLGLAKLEVNYASWVSTPFLDALRINAGPSTRWRRWRIALWSAPTSRSSQR